jgi:hypothetical protein
VPRFKVRFSRNNIDHNAEYFTVDADDFGYSTDGQGHALLTFFNKDRNGREIERKLFIPDPIKHVLYVALVPEEEPEKPVFTPYKEGA